MIFFLKKKGINTHACTQGRKERGGEGERKTLPPPILLFSAQAAGGTANYKDQIGTENKTGVKHK